MSRASHYLRFQSKEQFVEIAKMVDHIRVSPITGDEVIDVPGKGLIDVVGKIIDVSTEEHYIHPVTGDDEIVEGSAKCLPGYHVNIVYDEGQILPREFDSFVIDPPKSPELGPY